MKFNIRAVSLCAAVLLLLSFSASSQDVSAKKRGKFTTHYSDGKKESSGKVRNYKKNGTWKYWDSEGRLEKIITWKDDRKNGAYMEYFHDGTVSVSGKYADEKKDGIWKSFYEGGKPASVLVYTAGEYDGVQHWWYENGNNREISLYAGGTPVCKWTWYYNGRPKSFEYYSNGLADGTWRVYPDPSQATDTFPQSIDNYSAGKKNGKHLGYAHGLKTEEWNYTDDLLDGDYLKWDYTGNLGVKEHYVNGKKDGLCSYYNYGKLLHAENYKAGMLDGESVQYNSAGVVIYREWYREGEKDSAFSYFGNGKMATKRVYSYHIVQRMNDEWSVYDEWDSAGAHLLHGTYHSETKTGEWTTFYPDGKIKSVTPYDNGTIKGTYKKWYSNGKPLIEMECDGSNVVRPPKVWDSKGKPLKPGTKDYQELVDSSKPGEVYNDPTHYIPDRTKIPTDGLIFVTPVVTDQGDVPPPDDVDVEGNFLQDTTGMIFTFAEQPASFPGGQDSLDAFLAKNLRHPASCLGKSGKVFVQFVVEKDGTLSGITVARGIPGAPELSGEAVRVMMLSPKWNPAKQNGREVRYKVTLPVTFRPE
ncbi:MAG TPA: TonB family protein [Bacteroidia bacterium]|nr:TonB family protein [Bacteroidia bacterium]